MAKRLIKIAKELNVGTGTIVEHLLDSGFEIKNRPTAKVSDEMYNELLREFEGSISVKKEADKIDIGSARSKKSKEERKEKDTSKKKSSSSSQKDKSSEKEEKKDAEKKSESEEEKQSSEKKKSDKQKSSDKESEKKEEVAAEKDKVEEKASEEQETEKTEEKPKEKKKEEEKDSKEEKKKTEVKEDSKEKKEEEEKEDTSEKKSGLKVVGKIDLDKDKKKKKEEKSESEEEKQSSEKKEEKTEKKESEKESKEEEKNEPKIAAKKSGKKSKKSSDKKKEETIQRASKPKLKGLKIMGKIDSDKLKSRTKKKKKKKDKKKRKRKRKKIKAKKYRKRKKGNKKGGKKKDDQQEVTQKEIDEKIKATMARISGTSNKNKRKSRKSRKNKRKKKEEKQQQDQQQQEEQQEEEKVLEVTEFVSVSELANLMDKDPTDVITKCMDLGVIVSINQRLDAEVIELVASEFDFEVEFISAEEQTEEEDDWEDDPEDLEPRAPIITVMGHVDHGKTSLLDYIREATVATGEAGGITQHIGAYEVVVGNEDEYKKITFLDTPGHEAFTAMRARGAKITDVAVIIIAADDSIMPQTKEAISHAEAAGVPIIFAINKIDKPNADPERIINELAQMNYLVEEWGGKYQSQRISAKTGEGIDVLLEKITLEAELLELQANPDRPAIGGVIEASLDKGRGYVAKLLVQEGTLRVGDPVVAGEHSGKVKAMFNEFGDRVEEVGPSEPTLMLGLSGAPQAGEKFKVMESEQEAKRLANSREQIVREQTNRATKRISLDEIGRRLALGTFKELNLIVKGDVDGSVEALSDALIKQSVETIQVNVIHKAVGQIIESDVLLASASNAIIIGFQVRPSAGARELAKKEGIQIKTYSIIYEAIEEIRAAMEGMLEPEEEEKVVGQVEVREIYKISSVGTVAGCFVQEGYVSRNTHIRVVRDGIVIYPKKEGVVGEIDSLKRFKEDVKKVKSGLECGISIVNFNDIKVGDVIEAYEIVEIEQTL